MTLRVLCFGLLIGLLTAACAPQKAAQTAASGRAEFEARWAADGKEPGGLALLSGGDGQTAPSSRADSACVTTKADTTPRSTYLYFARVTAARPISVPMYVAVEYYDESVSASLTLQYDSDTGDSLNAKFRPAEDQAGGAMYGTHKWKRAYFLLQKPLLAHRQNLSADFRLSGGPLFLRSVRLLGRRPADWADVAKVEAVDVKPLVKIGVGGQLIVGGFDPAHVEDAPTMARSLESAAVALKQLGVTSHEGYVRWNLCEPREGVYNWSVYDRFVEVYRRQHLKWVPFLIVGSAYSLPDWYYKKPGSQGYICLEHGQESDVQSLWNPTLRRHVGRFIKAFCEHYRDTGVIESILLGVTGNYGEAIFPASGNDWTADIHGQYHTHAGIWAGDPYAIRSFQTWLTKKYGGGDRFRDAWGPRFPGALDRAKPFLRKDAPNDRAWLDFCEWYIGSMTEWSRFWLTETRRNFPKGDIYLCTGGHAPAEHGSDFGDQCKAAAEAHAGVRITNESSDYAANFSLTRWVASAGRQYGAYFSFEPASGVDANGIVARVYNATASGARGLHYYFDNLFSAEPPRARFIAYGSYFQQRRPITEIAIYYPETWIRLTGSDFLRYVRPLRSRFDFTYLSDNQIADGGLKNSRALVLLAGNVAETATWTRVRDWVRQGGILLYPDGMGRLRTVEGNEEVSEALFGGSPAVGRGRVLAFHGLGDSADYGLFAARALSEAPELSADTRKMARLGMAADGVFSTVVAPAHLLYLNTTDQDRVIDSATVPAHGIGGSGR